MQLTSPILSLPACNSLDFLERVFAAWAEGRVFAISRDPQALDGLGLSVETAPEPSPGGGWGRMTHRPDLSDAPAQITFSSGTEGRPKAIVISHRNLADVVLRLNEAMGVTHEIREYIGVPVTYSFGLGRARAVAAAGGAFFLPERFDPSQIRDMLATGEINAISAVPSLWRLVLTNPDVIGPEGSKVRWIEIGSQYMSAVDKLVMRDLFPNACIVQHYGLTEASRSTFLNVGQAPEDRLDTVGIAMGETQIRITEDNAIAIRGPHVALGTLAEGGKIHPLIDSEGWLVTRDRGEMQDGFLCYQGRLDDQINLAGVKLGAEAIEAEIRRMIPGAAEGFAIASVPDPMRGEAVLLAIETARKDEARLIEEAARLVLGRRGVKVGQGSGAALKVLNLDRLPRTGTDKIQRRQLLGIWTARQTERDNDPVGVSQKSAPEGMVLGGGGFAGRLPMKLSAAEAQVAALWKRVVGVAEITPEASFYDMGGDSLSSVQIGLVMEGAGLPRAAVRATMEGRSLRAVAALSEGAATQSASAAPAAAPVVTALPDAARRSWSITMMRAVMALSVLLSHWGPGLFGRLGIAQPAETALSAFYRMGTPGFAAVFGVGIGYFMLPDFPAKRASVLRRLTGAFQLVLMGMALLAAIRLTNLAVRGDTVSGLEIAHAFYGVLGYYALMLGTARWWLPPLARLRRPIPWLLAGLPALWIAWQIAPLVLPAQQFQSVLEWPRLMLLAGYNVFKMSAVAAAGMAVGFWLSRQRDSAEAARRLMLGGALAMSLASLSLIEAHGIHVFDNRSSGVFTSLPGLIFYIAFAGFGIGLFLNLLMAWDDQPRALRLPLQLLLVIGGLALPIYVFHGLVIPGRDLLVALGLGRAVALAASMGLFLAVISYSGKRLWRMYFG